MPYMKMSKEMGQMSFVLTTHSKCNQQQQQKSSCLSGKWNVSKCLHIIERGFISALGIFFK